MHQIPCNHTGSTDWNAYDKNNSNSLSNDTIAFIFSNTCKPLMSLFTFHNCEVVKPRN